MQIALFGESEKGKFHTPYFLKKLEALSNQLGNPPEDSRGIYFAIQTILYKFDLIFFRVEREGFSERDYHLGLEFLKDKKIKKLDAIALPGVGDNEIINIAKDICNLHKGIIILNEGDFYDYLTERKKK